MGGTFPLFRGVLLGSLIALIVTLLWSGPALRSGEAQSSTAIRIGVVWDPLSPNPFGAYLPEILRAEGWMAYEVQTLAEVSLPILQRYPVVLLAEIPLTPEQATVFRSYVENGGELIAMRPSTNLRTAFGLSIAGTLSEAYIRLDSSHPAGSGLTSESMQFHGTGDLYLPGGNEIIARFYSDRTTDTGYVAVGRRAVGNGRFTFWGYDLARSIALTRQGNPAWVGQDREADGILRTTDLFSGWIDLERVAIPQADEQMRLLSRLIRDGLGRAVPMPQLWYFPNGALSMLILTADAHGNSQGQYDREIQSIESFGNRTTLFLTLNFESCPSAPTPNAVNRWWAAGHTVGVHPYVGYDAETGANYGDYRTATSATLERFLRCYGPPVSRAIRTHQIRAGPGWVGGARVHADLGFLLDLDYYMRGDVLRRPDGTQAHGYLTGSGLPMRFIDENGVILSAFQQLTNIVDEQYMAQPFYPNWQRDFAEIRAMLDAAIGGYYTAFVANFHVDYYSWGEIYPWAEAIMAAAQGRGIPTWNADQWLDYVLNRDAARIQAVQWDPPGGNLSFSFYATPTLAFSHTLVLPQSFGGRSLTAVWVNGAPASPISRTLRGVPVMFLNIRPGAHSVLARYPGPDTPTASPTKTPSPTPTLSPTPGARIQAAARVEPALPIAGAPFTFTLAITNTGPSPIPSLVATTTLPSRVSGLACGPPPCEPLGTRVQWELRDLLTGQTRILTASFQSEPDLIGELSFETRVGSSQILLEGDTRLQITVPLTAAVDLVWQGALEPNPVVAGQPFTLSLSLENRGPSTAQSIRITVTSPISTPVTSCAPSCPPFTHPALSPRESIPLTLQMQADPDFVGSMEIPVEATSLTPEIDPVTNSYRFTLQVLTRFRYRVFMPVIQQGKRP